MGHKDIEWAYTLDLPSAQKAVVLALAHCRNAKTGKCFPSQKELCNMTGLSEATVRRSLGALETTGAIGREKKFKSGYRTNDNYFLNTDYRSERPPVTVTTGQPDHRSERPRPPVTVTTTTGHPDGAVEPTGIQPEVNTELIPTPRFGFADFWIVWPRKDSKKSAQTAWAKAIKIADSDTIYEAARQYSLHPHRPAKQYVPYAATWLNGERWTDPLPDAPEADRSKQTPTDRARAILALVPEPLKEIS